ncbi:PLP-dependent aminotransferase family protein [Chitinophaga sp. Mgbs1]|uniref:PLP-dependent aminotransferase family protein n=1 Tax=Chitinophaga solisilvae TaxID=1233460 RepID=A0A433WLP2_9BACT|nr:PLP-dependent aminotransferase family protein [Chitinophaga solisilvae]
MNTFQYISIAGKLERLINNNTYPVGDKLPSLRTVHEQYQVSIGTALKAFTLLADKGLIAGREKSGYVVLRKSVAQHPLPQGVSTVSGIREITVSKTLRKATFPAPGNTAFISFFGATPDTSLLPFNAIRRSLQQASRDLTGMHLQYETAAGHPLLRQEIARRSFRWNSQLSADDIIITNGALEAIHLCLRAVTQAGDTVVVATPSYFGVLQGLEQLKLNIIELPCDSAAGIDTAQLAHICSKFSVAACILISNFNNPNGVQLQEDKKEAIARFANRQKIPVIDDDIYGDLHFDIQRPTNIKSYDTNGWVMLCSSFSKTVAPGYRIGWCAPGRFTEQVSKLKAVTNIATTSIVQLSMLELLSTGAYDRHLRKLRVTLHKLVLLTTQAIATHFPAGTRISRPQGGLVLWVELPAGINAFRLQQEALAKHIDIAPGPLFSNSGDYRNYIRISCNHAWNRRVQQALKELGRIAHELM